MSDFFPDPPDAPEGQEDDEPGPVWLNPPDDMLPGIVPVELILGRSDQAVVMLAGMRAFPTGVAMKLLVRTRTHMRRIDLNAEVFDGPYRHDQDEAWRRDRLKWGFEFAQTDGVQLTSTPGPIRSTHSGRPNVLCSREVAGAVAPAPSTATTGCGRCHPLER